MYFIILYISLIFILTAYAVGIYFLIKRKLCVFSILLLPVVVLIIFRIWSVTQEQMASRDRILIITKMKAFDSSNPEAKLKLAMNSSVLFGSGASGDGGLIKADDIIPSELKNILGNSFDKSDKKSSIIWLIDSTASEAILKNNSLRLKNQIPASEGIWIGTIDGVDLEKVKYIKKDFY